jgi:GTP-dependent dephospho-CoA kinase
VSGTVKYQLPNPLRETLKEPLGYLFNEKQLFDYIKQTGSKIVCVGDQVSYTLLSHEISPLFCIIDNHTRRRDVNESKIEKIHRFGSKKITVENPAGVITQELWDVIQKLFITHDSKVLVIVQGEEDLAALPAILLAPSDVTIIYGMPDKGVVAVPATEHHKQKVKNIIAQM